MVKTPLLLLLLFAVIVAGQDPSDFQGGDRVLRQRGNQRERPQQTTTRTRGNQRDRPGRPGRPGQKAADTAGPVAPAATTTVPVVAAAEGAPAAPAAPVVPAGCPLLHPEDGTPCPTKGLSCTFGLVFCNKPINPGQQCCKADRTDCEQKNGPMFTCNCSDVWDCSLSQLCETTYKMCT